MRALALSLLVICSSLPVYGQQPQQQRPAHIQWSTPVELASGRGERGPWQQNDSRYDYVDDGTVAIAANGDLLIAWVNQGSKDVFFRRLRHDTGAASSYASALPPRNVSRNPASFSWLPRIAVSPDAPQTVNLIWQEILFAGGAHGGDIFFARSTDGGDSFAEPINLSASVGGDGKGRINKEIWHNGSLDLIAASKDRLYAAWTEYDGQLWFSRSNDGGQTFSAARRLNSNTEKPARAPTLASGQNGELYLAWTTGEDHAADIHFMQSADGGDNFSAPILIEKTPTYSDAPKLASAPDGVLHLVWAESRAGPFAPHRIRYTRSLDRGRSFAQPRDLSGPRVPGVSVSAAYPAIGVDRQARVVISWEHFPSADSLPQGLGIVVSADGGQRFSVPMIVSGSIDDAGRWNGSFQGRLMQKLAVGGDGRVVLVNSALKDGDSSRVWLLSGRLR